jgi:hypothetical protein
MTIPAFKEQTALGRTHGDQGYYPPTSIIRTPGDERRVTLGDLSAARGDKEPMQSTTDGKPRLCMMDCGTSAALADVYCADCRSRVGYNQHAT